MVDPMFASGLKVLAWFGWFWFQISGCLHQIWECGREFPTSSVVCLFVGSFSGLVCFPVVVWWSDSFGLCGAGPFFGLPIFGVKVICCGLVFSRPSSGGGGWR
ncbi:hypothetical protein L195_g040297 [Trifolium pratense]|uniref:Transmembrane protein n=1 Tax=Trifolium pratense TaxID=57577 RepID=A0A2K3K0M3_TRIPR|nr:hypothetical protein L195_g051605 [Trifolium pratense]PNX73303.1 hypothetical protein L195_g029202 [Trifolium pratense]PNX84240.1 hypothetical protein L195_g040297 [Trifolium pratense]